MSDNELRKLCLTLADAHKEPFGATVRRADAYLAFLEGRQPTVDLHPNNTLPTPPAAWHGSARKWQECVTRDAERPKLHTFDGTKISGMLYSGLSYEWNGHYSPLRTWDEVESTRVGELLRRPNLGAFSLCEIILRLQEMGRELRR